MFNKHMHYYFRVCYQGHPT